MQLFPERVRRGRRLLLAAALLSLFVHFVGGSIFAYLNRTSHKPGQSQERVAKISAITIEQIHPTPAPTPQPQPVARVEHHAPPAHRVELPQTPHFSVPTLAPEAVPSSAPHATVRHAPARVVAVVPVPRGARGGHAAVAGGLTSDQITAYEGDFRKTIAQAQQAVESTPAPAAVVTTVKDYNNVLHGSVDDIVGGEGVCNPVAEGQTHGIYTYYYLTCSVKYTDGYAERVSFPWPFKFTRRDDPFIRDDGPQRFPPQSPPPGFQLPHPFALSRAVCMYFHDECAAVLKREQVGGGPG